MNLLGIIDFELVKPILFNSFRIKFTKIEEIVSQPTVTINYEDEMELIIEKFESTYSQILPVIRYNKFFGFISKVTILEAYRDKLKEMAID